MLRAGADGAAPHHLPTQRHRPNGARQPHGRSQLRLSLAQATSKRIFSLILQTYTFSRPLVVIMRCIAVLRTF